MSLAIVERPNSYYMLRLGGLLLPALAAVIWGWLAWRDVFRTAIDHATAQSELVAQYVERMIDSQSLVHHAVRVKTEAEDADYLRSRAFHDFLRGIAEAEDYILGVALVSVDGALVASSGTYPASRRIGPRDYVEAIRSGDALFIDRIITAATKQDAFVVVTPLKRQGFDGMILSTFSNEKMTDFLRGIAVRDGEAASILRLDGKLLVRNFPAPPMMLPPDAPGRIYPQQNLSGYFVATAVSDGVTRIYAYRRAGDLPLVANFGVPTAIVWAQWSARAAPVIALFALMGLFGFISAERLRRGMLERFEAETNRKRMAEAERLADERIRLMRETNHRVKNNLSLVVSLINLQMRGKSGIDGNELKTRIGAISHVHDLMYQAEDGVHVDLGALLRDIASSPALVPREKGITVRCDIDDGIELGPDRTTPLALVAAELITNAVKHAFADGTGGTIRLGLHREGADVVMVVADDGVGLPTSGTGASRKSGAAIIEALVAQIGGTLTRETEGGARFTLRFRAG